MSDQQGAGFDGNGKADDLTDCSGSDAEYAEWFTSFKTSDAFRAALTGSGDPDLLAELEVTKPCVHSDESFLTWFTVWDHLWNEALDPRSGDFTLDTVERAGLEATLLAKPAGSSGAGYVAWLEPYRLAMSVALRPILNDTNTAILEERNIFNPDEEDALTLLEAAQPITEGRGAYANWIGFFDQFMTKATDPVSGNDIDQAESEYLDRVVARQPGVSADIAYLSWLQIFRDRYESAASATSDGAQALSDSELIIFDRYQAVRAQGVDERPYLAWLGEFSAALSSVMNSSGEVTDVGRSHLELWLGARPCGDSDAIRDAWAPLESAMGRVGAEVAELIGQAEPSACQ